MLWNHYSDNQNPNQHTLSMNPNCKCELAGYCTRHKMSKNDRQLSLCKGTAVDKPDCGFKFWLRWESGAMGATAPVDPVLEQNWGCDSKAVRMVTRKIPQRETDIKESGLGDKISNTLSLVGITEERVSRWLGAPCGCAERREKLNKLGSWLNNIWNGVTDGAKEKLEDLIK